MSVLDVVDPQADILNQVIKTENPTVYSMLSSRGRKIYFPKMGILSQGAMAKGKNINATIGTALAEDGSPLCLPSIAKQLNLSKTSIFPYAPSFGLNEIRKQWGKMLVEKNPGLENKKFSTPVVTNALTHGLGVAAYLFCNDGDCLLTPDLYWENYDLLFNISFGAQIKTYSTFNSASEFNFDALEKSIDQCSSKKIILILNFPNNPTGYTLLEKEILPLKTLLLKKAQQGRQFVVLIDDAYFGLVFEKNVYTQSIFVDLCDLHENILAVKLDGATKEDYVWGLRVGFITFGVKGGSDSFYKALEDKCGGCVRANISNVSMPGQSVLLNAWKNPDYVSEKKEAYHLLKKRFDLIKQVFTNHPEYQSQFTPLPFNSGYFMCVKLTHSDPEKIRQRLLNDYSTGLINLCGLLRIAFSSIPTDKIEILFENLYNACLAESAQ